MTPSTKKTLVIGASTKPGRYSNAAVRLLQDYGHPVIALAKRAGYIDRIPIITEFPVKEKIHTVTLYIGPKHQPEYLTLLKALKPERVIFNPGTFNNKLKSELEKVGIKTVEGCTLIMLRSDDY